MDITAPRPLREVAEVDSASVKPFPSSYKRYIEGSRPDIRVAMREVQLTATTFPVPMAPRNSSLTPPCKFMIPPAHTVIPMQILIFAKAYRLFAKAGSRSAKTLNFSTEGIQITPHSGS